MPDHFNSAYLCLPLRLLLLLHITGEPEERSEDSQRGHYRK